jgi:O-antigen ligase
MLSSSPDNSIQASASGPAAPWLSLVLLLGLVPLAGVFAPKGVAPIVIASAIIGTYLLVRSGRFTPDLLPLSFGLPLIGLLVWAGLSAIWAADPLSAITGTLRLAGNLLAGTLFLAAIKMLDDRTRQHLHTIVLIGWSAAIAVLLIEITFGGPIFYALYGVVYDKIAPSVGPFWLSTGVAVAIVLFWPLTVVVSRRAGWMLPAIAGAVLFFISYRIQYLAGTMALLLGAGAIGAIWILGRRGAIILAILVTVGSLALPFALRQMGEPGEAVTKAEPYLSGSALHRLAIWSFAARRIDEKPIAGWGLNASKEIVGGKDVIVDMAGKRIGPALPLHPHNIALQIWLELGAVGIVLYCALIVALVMVAASSPMAPVVLGQLVTTLVIANISYGIWQAWWIASLWCATALTVSAARTPARALKRARPPPAGTSRSVS